MLKRFFHRIEENAETPAGGPVLIVALGDSVTQGCMAAGKFDFRGVYHQRLKSMLETRFPHTTFSVINAGVGGEKTSGGLQRLERDVLRHQPDLLLLAFCLNDACDGQAGLSAYRVNIGEIIQRIRQETKAEIIVLTPNFMVSESNSRIDPQHLQYVETIVNAQNRGIVKAYTEALKETAATLNVAIADVYAQWEKLQRQGAHTNDFLINGLNHPDEERQRLIAQIIMDLIIANEKV